MCPRMRIQPRAHLARLQRVHEVVRDAREPVERRRVQEQPRAQERRREEVRAPVRVEQAYLVPEPAFIKGGEKSVSDSQTVF